MFFTFCLVLKTDEDLLILFLKKWYIRVFLFCDDTNANTAIPRNNVLNCLGIQNFE